MKRLMIINLILTLGAIGTLLWMKQWYEPVWHDLDTPIHWAPIRFDTDQVLLPLNNSRVSTSYSVIVRIDKDVVNEIEGLVQQLSEEILIRGHTLAGEDLPIFVSNPRVGQMPHSVTIGITLQSEGIVLLSVEIPHDLRGSIESVGTTVSFIDVKLINLATDITSRSMNQLLVILLLLLSGQIIALILLIRRHSRAIRGSQREHDVPLHPRPVEPTGEDRDRRGEHMGAGG